MPTSTAILARPIDVGQLPASGLVVALTASPEERRRLAEAYDLREVRSLDAEATVLPASGGAVTVEGRVIADIVQTCVISLVPVDQHIDEPFAARFVGPDSLEVPRFRAGTEVQIGTQEEDPPEILDGPTINFGAIVEEHFVLAIDPYPRAPGAELAQHQTPAEERAQSPFAALASLTRRDDQKG
jgi:uncharacterized metal-binding protein YceD (DUF177 family)